MNNISGINARDVIRLMDQMDGRGTSAEEDTLLSDTDGSVNNMNYSESSPPAYYPDSEFERIRTRIEQGLTDTRVWRRTGPQEFVRPLVYSRHDFPTRLYRGDFGPWPEDPSGPAVVFHGQIGQPPVILRFDMNGNFSRAYSTADPSPPVPDLDTDSDSWTIDPDL